MFFCDLLGELQVGTNSLVSRGKDQQYNWPILCQQRLIDTYELEETESVAGREEYLSISLSEKDVSALAVATAILVF